MPTWLLNPTVWKLAGAALAALVLAIFVGTVYHRYESYKASAALVPGLQAQVRSYQDQLKSVNDRITAISADLAKARTDLIAAQAELNRWGLLKTDFDGKLEEMIKHASAATNAVCLPSAGERQLFNDATGQLAGTDARAR